MWPIIASFFPLKPRVKTHGFNIWKSLCNSSTDFVHFNSWQKVDGETSIVKFRHHLRAYLEGLTKFWGFGGLIPSYSLFCTLKSCTFDAIPLANPKSSATVKYATSIFNEITWCKVLPCVTRAHIVYNLCTSAIKNILFVRNCVFLTFNQFCTSSCWD